MSTAFPPQTADWGLPVREFLLHNQAHRAPRTLEFYRYQLACLVRCADKEGVGFDAFGKRHMDRYTAERRKTLSPTTLQQDGVVAKAFFRWCSKNDLIDRSPLAEYEVRRAPRPEMYMPTLDDVRTYLTAVGDYRDVAKNPSMKYFSRAIRTFHRERDFAVAMLLVDTACRVGEALSLKVGDYDAKNKQITVTQSKGREPRRLPLDAKTVLAVEEWLKIRNRVMKDASDDEGWLIVSETGGRILPNAFSSFHRRYRAFAKLPAKMTVHSLRRFSLNKHAKNNIFAAQQLAGHKSPNTTMLYVKLDADYVRAEHAKTDVMGSVFASKREKRKRLI